LTLKFYIAARVSQREEVKRIGDMLTNKGHTSLSTWVDEGNIKPYDKHSHKAEARAIECIKAIEESDVFVLISDKTGAGMYTELGVAIASNLLRKKPIIFIVGDHTSRSVFFFHPSVTRRENLSEVIQDISSLSS
jgi:hypothetical protein